MINPVRPRNAKTNHWATAIMVNRRRILAGELQDLEKATAEKREELCHMDASLALFWVQNPEAIKPLKPYRRVLLFKNGELAQCIRDILRHAGRPMRTQEVIDELLKIKGHSPEVMPVLKDRVRSSLKWLASARKQVVRSGGPRKPTWTLV